MILQCALHATPHASLAVCRADRLTEPPRADISPQTRSRPWVALAIATLFQMPVKVSSGGNLADIHISNSSRLSNRQDASSSVDGGASGTASAHNRNVPNQMASNRDQGDLSSESDRIHPPTDSPSALIQIGKQKQVDYLQIPSKDAGHKPPSTTAVWDWETGLDFIDDTNDYYYEPQGELLRAEQFDHSQPRDEFSIPHAVESTGITVNVDPPVADEEGFLVPPRPSSSVQGLAGSKRKSSTEGGGGKQPEPKRASRAMSDTTEGASPPTESASTSSGARPQAGPASRLRSHTDVSEARPAAGRPGVGRRTLTDPSTPMVLPARKVFPIQIGDKLFRLSGASISSDGKSATWPP